MDNHQFVNENQRISINKIQMHIILQIIIKEYSIFCQETLRKTFKAINEWIREC